MSDVSLTLAAVAVFAEGPTRIYNVENMRIKETDRIAALATELRRIGQRVEELRDGIVIHPRPVTPAKIETYNDHRMAMSFAVVGLRAPGIAIRNPSCVSKTFPDFFRKLEKL
jgi:3-phosphoshikimate 1-carboxyvinyltransferase